MRLLELLAPKPATARTLTRAVLTEAFREGLGRGGGVHDLGPATIVPWMWLVSAESRKPAIDEYRRVCEAAMRSGDGDLVMTASQWALASGPVAQVTRPPAQTHLPDAIGLAEVSIALELAAIEAVTDFAMRPDASAEALAWGVAVSLDSKVLGHALWSSGGDWLFARCAPRFPGPGPEALRNIVQHPPLAQELRYWLISADTRLDGRELLSWWTGQPFAELAPIAGMETLDVVALLCAAVVEAAAAGAPAGVWGDGRYLGLAGDDRERVLGIVSVLRARRTTERRTQLSTQQVTDQLRELGLSSDSRRFLRDWCDERRFLVR
jgi:hypothetical protein